mmetsp:Transcript_135322/g.234624  ORF Transcript_135322/g.234624 Transcript_135322/m.234624 type:complete len:491 (-) Transcript_135322:1286-2758(-)
MGIPKNLDSLRKDVAYLKEQSVHHLLNHIATDLLADKPQDVLLYLDGWITNQLRIRAMQYPPDGYPAPSATSSRAASEIGGQHSLRGQYPPTSEPMSGRSAARPTSRQSSVNVLRRTSYADPNKPPEKVVYPPSAALRMEAWAGGEGSPLNPSAADTTANSTAKDEDSFLLGSPVQSEPASKPDWRPSPESLKKRFPSPYENYHLGERISSGHYGTVYKGINKSNDEIVAIKKVAIDGHWVVSEYDNLVHCTSKTVVGCDGCYYSEEEDMLWLVMEFLNYTLERDLPNGNYLKEEFLAGVIQQLLVALRDVHAKGRVHLDVKPANLLYSRIDDIKLGDFGTMATIGEPCIQLGDFCFMAPEVAYSRGLFTDRSDVWSVGAVAITLADGGPPLCREDPKLLMYIHYETCMVPSLWEPHRWSKEFRDFLSRCFVKDTEHRPSCDELLKDPWIAKYATNPHLVSHDRYQAVPRKGVNSDSLHLSQSVGNAIGV